MSCKWQKYSEVTQVSKERKVLSRTVYEESVWMISALTVLWAGSTCRNKMLLLPVSLGWGWSLKDTCFKWWKEGSGVERSLLPLSTQAFYRAKCFFPHQLAGWFCGPGTKEAVSCLCKTPEECCLGFLGVFPGSKGDVWWQYTELSILVNSLPAVLCVHSFLPTWWFFPCPCAFSSAFVSLFL